MDDAVQTVMTQCELWTDTADMNRDEHKIVHYSFGSEQKQVWLLKQRAIWKEGLILAGMIY